MENIALCQICKIREGQAFDEQDRWVCDQCEYLQNYHEFDLEEDYDEEEPIIGFYRF